MKKVIGVLMGGYSSEFEISILSGTTVLNNLSTEDFDVYAVHILKKGWFAVVDENSIPIDRNTFTFELNGRTIQFDGLFNAVHGTPGEDGKLQGYLEMMGIPHTSCDSFEAALTFNKGECNQVLRDFGIRCAPSVYLHPGQNADYDLITRRLNFPVFVKPSRAGSSFGVSRVETPGELDAAVEYARSEDDRVIVEQGVIGTEVGCGAFMKDGEVIILPLTEIVPKNAFFDYKAKYNGESEEITPARISDAIASEIAHTTKKVYEMLHLKGIVRVDYIIEKTTGLPYLIEVNTVPGLSPASIVPQQVREAGMTLKDFFTFIVVESLSKSR